MSKLLLDRRRLLGLGAASAGSLLLAGCDQFDFLRDPNNNVRNVIEQANQLTYGVQRAAIGNTLAPEYAESEIRQGQKPNGSTDPRNNPDYAAIARTGFATYQLKITGLVEEEKVFSLAELRNMPSRTQITRHDCVEGWSCIAKWTGTPLGPVLDQARLKPAAKYLVFHCFDSLGGGLSGPEVYYESCDLVDAHHPQTILAYGLNNQSLPIQNGAPIRVRIERALGYKQPKYVHTIEAVDSFSRFGRGSGGYWEDHGYDWYGGI